MNADTLRTASTCPPGLTPELRALWNLAQGDWEEAHRLVQDETGPAAAWVHAHLHRAEGDQGNAGYWYCRADRPLSRATLDDEWEQIVAALLKT